MSEEHTKTSADMLKLHNLKPSKDSKKGARRVGRGQGSGRGKTAGRGTKGQKARAGGKGGLKRIGMKDTLRRIPKKRGFSSIRGKDQTVTLSALAKVMPDSGFVTPNTLQKAGLIEDPRQGIKIVGQTDLNAKYTVKGCKVSEGAKAVIEKAGGSVVA